MNTLPTLSAIVARFATEGTVTAIEPLGHGLINDTYRVRTEDAGTPDYVLQRINDSIFTDVALLQHNIELVTSHLRRKLEQQGTADLARRVLQLVPTTADGHTYTRDADGNYWRMTVFIAGAVTVETVDTHYSREAGRAFGEFELMLSDLSEPLGITIPHFHDMEFRLSQLHEAVSRDVAERAALVADLLAAIDADAERMCQGERLAREGRLPQRICHCDTKVNNMLFDAQTGECLLVIDLDRVMPSLFFSDYGGVWRSAANATREDDANLANVRFRDDIFKAFTEGYLLTAGQFLTPLETELLPYAAELFPFMQGVRFLWDYLSGDHYWKCQYADHNLDRARNQLRLYQEVCAHETMMKETVAHYAPKK
jgi:Ser/Thr protein kinase RdoA (MazF antagonist)